MTSNRKSKIKNYCGCVKTCLVLGTTAAQVWHYTEAVSIRKKIGALGIKIVALPCGKAFINPVMLVF
ncbi:hypothetical protein [uncultured Nostoc sp.]|uniref:hypothetical protein n=1 Tax=uncultured Nostoc sp. TaxID=340711 RepID=UPI0035C967D3